VESKYIYIYIWLKSCQGKKQKIPMSEHLTLADHVRTGLPWSIGRREWPKQILETKKLNWIFSRPPQIGCNTAVSSREAAHGSVE
jgi:hypothetical protein